MPTPPAEIEIPCGEALLAATLALMTAYAGPAPDARPGAASQRRLMACRIVSHLGFLRADPALSPGLRQVLGAAHHHWLALAVGGTGAATVH